MDFRTEIKLAENKRFISHSDGVMMIGSCFSDNIGGRLTDALMNVDVNPFGTLYNPASIRMGIERIVSGEQISENELFQANGVWNHFGYHSKFSGSDKAETLQRMNERLAKAHNHLRECKVLAITLGTSIVYVYKESQNIVGNCHKLPSVQFERRMLSFNEVRNELSAIVKTVRQYNNDIKVIFTVSPIRHVADGLEQNQLSKSTLRVAVSEIVSENEGVADYFPAYEIMIDDLRDYRFYAADMVHPSDVAVEYIWEKFRNTYFTDAALQAVARCEKVSKRLRHRIMTDNEEVAERFRQGTLEAVRNLIREYPHIEKLTPITSIL